MVLHSGSYNDALNYHYHILLNPISTTGYRISDLSGYCELSKSVHMPCGTGNIIQIVNFHIKKHRTTLFPLITEPEHKQRDRKCPIFKAFQSLNVPNFLFKLGKSKDVLKYIYLSLVSFLPLFYFCCIYYFGSLIFCCQFVATTVL